MIHSFVVITKEPSQLILPPGQVTSSSNYLDVNIRIFFDLGMGMRSDLSTFNRGMSSILSAGKIHVMSTHDVK